jgi:hypothetical protein
MTTNNEAFELFLSKDKGVLRFGEELTDGTFDNKKTNTRQVFVNGIMAYDIPSYVIPNMRDRAGNKVEMFEFGHFPDFPINHLPDATKMTPSNATLTTHPIDGI